MRIFVDARMLHIGGTMRIATSLMAAMLERHADSHEFTVLLAPGQDRFEHPRARYVSSRTRHPAAWIAGDAWRLPRLVREAAPDVFHSLKRPQIGRVNGRRIITINSTYPWLYPEFQGPMERLYWTPLMTRAVHQADAVVVLSETDREHLCRLVSVPAEKVVAIPCAAEAEFRPQPEARVAEVRRRLGLPERYVLFVGNTFRYKNLPNLVRGFGKAVRRAGLPHVLVLVGARSAGEADVARTIEADPSADRVLRLEPPRSGLAEIYAGAEALLFPTKYDSFGMPVLEAMSTGTPVLISSGGALEEVAGDAAAVVDPDDTDSIAEGILRLLQDPELLRDLRERGFARARRFSWAASADMYVELYRRVAA